jgi:hypothetical protein
LVVPSFEIISNFPVYKIWSKEYKLIIKYLKEKIYNSSKSSGALTSAKFSGVLTSHRPSGALTSPQPSPTGEGVEQIIITRTRFFLTSFI